MNKIIVSILMCCFTFTMYATKYYVSNSGNDNNDGLTEQTAWKTLAKVQTEANINRTFIPGDIIAFKGGENFYGKLLLDNVDGTSGNLIIITSYGSGKATINGTVSISGFKNDGGSIWSVNTSDPIYQVFNNHTHLKNGAMPVVQNKNDTYKNFYTVSSVSTSKTFTSEQLIGFRNIVGSSIHIRTVTWIYETRKVTAFNSATGKLTIDLPTVNPISSDEDIFFINNHKNLLTKENDWSYDTTNNKLYLYSTIAPSNIYVTNKSDSGILIKECSYLEINNIRILGYEQTGLKIELSDNIEVNNISTEYNYNVGIQTVANRSNIIINNSKEKGSNAAGYNLGDTVSTVENCEIHDSGIIHNLNWNSVNTLQMQSYGIYSEKTAIIKNNIIHDIGRNGIYFNGASVVEKNYIYDFGLYFDDSGAIYSWNANIVEKGYNGAIIRNNIVESSKYFDDKWKVHGIYMDGRGRGVTISDNTIINCNQGIRMRAIRGSKILNNNIYGSKNGSIVITHTENDNPDSTPMNNLIQYNNILNTNIYHSAFKIMNYRNNSFDIGILNNNKYANLCNQRDVTVFTNSLKRDYKLSDWKNLTSQSALSKTSDLNFEQYSVKSTLKQKITNSTFDNDVLGWEGWQTKRIKVTDSSNSYLRTILTGSSGVLKSNKFSIKKGITYLIKFDIKTNIEPKDYDLQFSIKNASTNEFDYYVHPDTEWRTYEFKFTSEITESSEYLEFYILNSNNEIHIDNIYFDEVIFDTKGRTYIAYNKEKIQQSVNLPSGTWNDLDGKTYVGSVSLPAFRSVLLFLSENTTGSINANAGSDQIICLGESVTLTASGGSSYSWNTGATTKSITVNPNETTTYTVTVSEGSASDSDSVQVTVNSVTAGAGGNQTITAGESVTLTASGGDSYVWNTGATTQSITVTPTATTTYTVTAKQGDCEDTDSVKVTVNAAATVTANAGSDQTICLGESVTLTASGGSSYSWNTGATTKSITVNPNETTTYTVTVSEGSASDSDSVQVTVNSVTAGAGGNQTITAGESVTLTASGGDAYIWNTGATTQSITVTPTVTTTYTVTAKQGDCEDTDTVQVTVNQNNDTTVTANAGSDQTICLGESVTLTASGGSSYSWNTGATTKSITVNPNETTTYTVTVSEGSTSDSDSVTVTVNSVTANASSDKSITAGESVTLTASGGDSYVWNTGATTQSITVSPTATTTYTVTAKQGDCEDTDTVQVTVNQNNDTTVTANAGSDQTICLGESITLTASGGSSYSWNTGATTKSITVNPNETTTYTVTVSEGSASDSDSVIVTVNTVTANAGADKTIYEGESVTLSASGGDAYLWSNGSKAKSITVSPQETQTYSLTAYKGGCEDTDTVQVTVNKKDTSPPPAKANAGEDQTICLGESITLTASGGKTYSWSTGETTKSIQVNPTRTTSYTVTATRGGVTNSDAVVVTVENCSAISEDIPDNEFTVYPNPTGGDVNISVKNIKGTFSVFVSDVKGSIVFSENSIKGTSDFHKKIDFSRFAAGIYYVGLNGSDVNEVQKLVLVNR